MKSSAGSPGSFGFEEQDAIQYASWGVDFLKQVDCCGLGLGLALGRLGLGFWSVFFGLGVDFLSTAIESCGRGPRSRSWSWSGSWPWP